MGRWIGSAAVSIVKSINAGNPFLPTAAEDANDPTHPASCPSAPPSSGPTWSPTRAPSPLTVVSVTDDNGTPANTADDFHPEYVSGDTNGNGLLDPGEVWLYTSAGVETYQATAALYGNSAR